MCVGFSHAPNLGSSLQPRQVPWLGIEPATLWFAGQQSIHWATPARVFKYFSSHLILNPKRSLSHRWGNQGTESEVTCLMPQSQDVVELGLGLGRLASEPLSLQWNNLNWPTVSIGQQPARFSQGQHNEKPNLSSVGPKLKKSCWGDSWFLQWEVFFTQPHHWGRAGGGQSYPLGEQATSCGGGGRVRPSKLRIKIRHRLKNSLLIQRH